jgi:hypothetical protein
MSRLQSRDWLEGIGILAIVASLVFVGLQLKQSHEIALAEQYQSRAEATQSLFLSVLESEGRFVDDGTPLSELSPEDLEVAYITVNWAWTQYDNHFFQYQAGFLDEESWIGLGRRIERLYSSCEVRFFWEGNKAFYRQSFVEYVESLENPCST